MVNNVGKDISKNVSGIYSQKALDHGKQPDIDPLKTVSKKVIQKSSRSNSRGNMQTNILNEYFD